MHTIISRKALFIVLLLFILLGTSGYFLLQRSSARTQTTSTHTLSTTPQQRPSPTTQSPSSALSLGQHTNSTTPAAQGAQQPQSPLATAPTTFVPQQRVFPTDFGMANVKTRYGARGDGVTDDTAAIQRALADGRGTNIDYFGRPKALYFPAGTYLVSNTLQWNGCCVTLQGQGSQLTTIRLKDRAPGFSTAAKPKAVILTPDGNMSFRQNVWNLGISTGNGNPGAIGLDFIASNTGSVEDVLITSGDGNGVAGLAMTRGWPGPCLIKNLAVTGFTYGIQVGGPEYGPTFEHIYLQHQQNAGIYNDGNILAIRDLHSLNSVPAVRNVQKNGSVILVDGTLEGGAATTSALVSVGYLYARNIHAKGYLSAIMSNSSLIPGNEQAEFLSDKAYTGFTSAQRSLNLPIAETPASSDDNPALWARFSPSYYGDTAPLQGLLNSGKSTIYFPFGGYLVGKITVTVPATVKRIIGYSSIVNTWADGGGLTFRVVGNSTQPLIVEQFGYGVTVEQASARPVVIKHGFYNYVDTLSSGDLFLEDSGTRLNLIHPHRVWVRQLNSEGSDQTQVTNKGATVWILGIKTEGSATVIDTTNGGQSELLGSLIYPAHSFTADEARRPAFRSVDSHVSVLYGYSSYVNNGFYSILIQETRNGQTRQLLASAVPQRTILYTSA